MPLLGATARPVRTGTQIVQSPFAQPGVNANPMFVPQPHSTKSQGAGAGDIVKPKPPDKPLGPYMRFSKRTWDKLRMDNPKLKLEETGRQIGQMWRELADDEKKGYNEEYERDKAEYTKALQAYHNSPAYQQYVRQKDRQMQQARTVPPPGQQQPPHGVSGAPMHQTQTVNRVYIQAVDEYDEPSALPPQLSYRNLAYARYQRNHRLIAEIFSTASVPDCRTVVTAQRMSVLKKQVDSLDEHQNKLLKELEMLEERFKTKKQKIVEEGEGFLGELDQVNSSRVHVTDDVYEQMVKDESAKLLDAYEQYKKVQEQQALIQQQQQQQLAQQQQQQPTSQVPTPQATPPAQGSPSPAQTQQPTPQSDTPKESPQQPTPSEGTPQTPMETQ